MTRKNKTIPCVDIPIKFLRTPYVSDLQQIILDWFDKKKITYKLCHLQGKYSIIFADHSDALQFKLVMGHWEDVLPEPDFLFSSGTTTFAGNLMPSSGYITVGGAGGVSGAGGAGGGYVTISSSNGVGASGGGGGYSYSVGPNGISVSVGPNDYYFDDTNGSK